MHDFGCVVLLGGRRIAFGQPGEAERILGALHREAARDNGIVPATGWSEKRDKS